MENTQPSSGPNQMNTETQPRQHNSKNNNLLVVIVISVLLTVVITGSVVYFWQKSANDKVISNLEKKIVSLEDQISMINRVQTAPRLRSSPEPSPTTVFDVTADWKTYASHDFGVSFKYPAGSQEVTTRKANSEGGRCNQLGRFIDLQLNSGIIKFDLCGIPYGIDGSATEQLEITQQPIIINGKQVVLADQQLIEKKIYNKETSDQYLIVTIDYPPGSKNALGEDVHVVSIRYQDVNALEADSELFHRILSTFKFAN